MAVVLKATITPVYYVAEEYDDDNFSRLQQKNLQFDLGCGVFLEDVSSLMQTADFSLWAHEHLSKDDVQRLQGWKYALVHRYESEENLQSSPEEESRLLVHRAFIGVRIVRPSSKPYEYVQGRITSSGNLDPSGFSRAANWSIPVPQRDRLGIIRYADAENVGRILPVLLEAYSLQCKPVTRAIRLLELGYNADGFDAKQLLWTTGLDGLFTSSRNWGSPLAIRRIVHLLGEQFVLYRREDFPSYVVPPNIFARRRAFGRVHASKQVRARRVGTR
jgi:hypothetical protein